MTTLSYDPTHCTLCPRRCGADRTQAKGRCRMPDAPWSPAPPCTIGRNRRSPAPKGPGPFSSRVQSRLRFLPERQHQQNDFGKAISVARLREIFFELIAAGAHNIDLVNPTHYAHVVAQALEDPLPVPVVWNSGGYDRVETLAALEGKIQIYLPDYKYTDPDTARRYAGAADYPETARTAIREMVRQTGPYQLDENGILTRGVILRHLLLPGGLNQAKEVMDWVAETFPPHTILFSLMSQYTPWGKAADYPPLDRRLRKSEIRAAEAYFTNLGLDGFTQGVEAAQADYIPTFDLTGV